MKHRLKVCTIGGGTGTAVVAAALKNVDQIDLKAIVSVCDNGGSTGRLRDEFGFLPVGDLRQALAALATEKNDGWIRKLLLYRFEKGSGLEGHNLGNLILTALQDMSGSTDGALEIASKIFRLNGEVLPITTDNVNIKIIYDDETVLIGEKNLDEYGEGKSIKRIELVPEAAIYEKAKKTIEEADYIIIGPGDLYGSIMANLVVEGVKETFAKTKAKIVYIMSLMTKYTQTNGLSASNHLEIIEKEIGKKVNYVLVNNEIIPSEIVSLYALNHDNPVVDDLGDDPRVIRTKLIRPVKVVQSTKDTVVRSYLRHDSEKLRRIFREICRK